MTEIITIKPLRKAKIIADLVNSVWQAQYPDDRNLCIWPEMFFEWQFLAQQHGRPSICLAAYLGDEPVGLHCGDIWDLNSPGPATARATYLSCVSVRKIHVRQHVSDHLLAAMKSWSAGHGAHQFFGYVNPSESKMAGRRYWSTRRMAFAFLSGGRQWQIIPERLLSQTHAKPIHDHLNLDAAVDLLHEKLGQYSSVAQLGVVWTKSRIRHQLRFAEFADVIQVWDGADQAVCNYHVLPTHGGWNICNIDFIAASKNRIDLAGAALQRIAAIALSRNCRRILTTGTPTNDGQFLEKLGLVPCIPSFTPMMATWSNDVLFGETTSLKLFYR